MVLELRDQFRPKLMLFCARLLPLPPPSTAAPNHEWSGSGTVAGAEIVDQTVESRSRNCSSAEVT